MGIHSRKLFVPRRFYNNPSDVFSKLGLSRGHNLKGMTSHKKYDASYNMYDRSELN
jgi:hypothetical protein